MVTGRGAAMVQELLGELPAGPGHLRTPPVPGGDRAVRAEDDQCRLLLVGDVPGGCRGDDDMGELAGARRHGLEHIDRFPGDVGGVEGGGPVDDHPVDRRLPVVPAPGPLVVDVGGSVGEHLQGGAEVAQGVPGHGHAEEEPLTVDALVGGVEGGGGAEEQCAGDAPGQCPSSEQLSFPVDAQGCGVLAVDVGLDDGAPGVVEVAGDLVADGVVVEGDGARHDEGGVVVGLDQGVDHGAHEAQDAAGALEPLQGGPVAVEPVEQLGVDGVGLAQPPLVVRLEGLGGQLAALPPVVVDEPLDGGVALADGLGVEVGEQAPAHDLEALPGGGGAPVVGHAPNDVLEPLEGLAAAVATNLELGGAGDGAVLADVGGGDGDEEEGPGGALDSGGELLGEGELGVEAAAGQAVAPVQAAGVGDPFVDEDEGGGVAADEGAQGGTGVGAGAVGLRDELVGLGAAELPGELAPQRVNDRSVRLGGGLPGGDLVADDGDAPDPVGDRGVGEQLLDVLGEVLERGRAGQVPGGEHGVGLAAAEGGLKVDDGLGVGVPGQPPGGHGQEGLEPLGEVGALEEAGGVAVLLTALPVGDLVQVGGVLGLAVVAGDDVGVGADDVLPGCEAVLPEAGHGDGARPGVAPGGGVEGGVQRVPFHGTDLVGLGGGVDGPQEALGGVEGAIGVVHAEGAVVRPFVADLAQLAGEVLLAAGEDPAEEESEVPNAFGDDAQLALGVGGFVGPVRPAVLPGEEVGPGAGDGQLRGDGDGDPGLQGPGEDLDGPADAVPVGGGGHVSGSPGCRGRVRSGCQGRCSPRSGPRRRSPARSRPGR